MELRNLIHDRAIEIGKLAVRMTTKAGSGHPSSALSLAHIVAALMYKVMRYDPADPWNPYSDRLVLSEGHAVPIIYAAYADLGGVVGKTKDTARRLTIDDVETLRRIDSCLDGHPNPAEGFPFFDAATGSLGQGLSVGAGLALAARRSGIDKMIYVICGDGEAREGQIWEAADFIVDYNITNLCAIINCNGQGQADYVSVQQSAEVLEKKFLAYGFDVNVIDGHDPDAILDAFGKACTAKRPYVIIAKTVKGWGVPDLQDKSNHGKPLPEEKLSAAIEALESMRKGLSLPSDIDSSSLRPSPPKVSGKVPPRNATIPIASPDFAKLLGKPSPKLATRKAYGLALRAIAEKDPRILALDADVSNSTFAMYIKDVPERFYECKIAEQNMVSVAAGLAAAGYIPFVSTFGKFLVRAYDQVEMAVISRANIKFVGSHVGITLAADGPSQMGLVDFAFFRSFSKVDENGRPLVVIFNPADAVCAYWAVKLAAEREGIVYIRTMRPDTPILYKPDEEFKIGGSKLLREGKDLLIVATGYMVHEAMKAIEQLEKEGVSAGLIDAYSFPLDALPVVDAAKKASGKILTVEDNYIGGLASEVSEIAAFYGGMKVDSMYVRKLPKSGIKPDDLLAYCGLSSSDIVKAAKKLL